MENSYLKIAADVLCVVRKPMSAKEIVGLAIERGMMPKHLYGKTPHKTMQARLSEDIVARQRASAFFRTGAGEFFLRSLQSDESVPSEYKQEYIAPRRKLQLPREYILTTKSQLWEREFSAFEGIPIARFDNDDLRHLFDYMTIGDIHKHTSHIPVISFVVVHKFSRILTHIVGRFRTSDDVLHGARSIGFGSYVQEQDNGFLYDSKLGIIESGVSALCQGAGLPADLAERARYNAEIVPRAFIRSKTHEGRDAVFLIADFECPEGFDPGRPNLSFTGLSWLKSTQIPNDVSNFDPVSRQMLATGNESILSPFWWA